MQGFSFLPSSYGAQQYPAVSVVDLPQNLATPSGRCQQYLYAACPPRRKNSLAKYSRNRSTDLPASPENVRRHHRHRHQHQPFAIKRQHKYGNIRTTRKRTRTRTNIRKRKLTRRARARMADYPPLINDRRPVASLDETAAAPLRLRVNTRLQNAMPSSEERTSAEAEGYRIERTLMDRRGGDAIHQCPRAESR